MKNNIIIVEKLRKTEKYKKIEIIHKLIIKRYLTPHFDMFFFQSFYKHTSDPVHEIHAH